MLASDWIAATITALALLALSCSPAAQSPLDDGAALEVLRNDRAPELGPDGTELGGIRVILETGAVNGGGTTRPVLLWVNNVRHIVGDPERVSLSPGERHSAVLSGPGVPRTLGQLRRSSVVLALELGDAAIGASWHCSRAVIEVRLPGEESYRTYLENDEVGWLSMGEPPRRSPLYALQ